jgi:hypothetical protein
VYNEPESIYVSVATRRHRRWIVARAGGRNYPAKGNEHAQNTLKHLGPAVRPYPVAWDDGWTDYKHGSQKRCRVFFVARTADALSLSNGHVAQGCTSGEASSARAMYWIIDMAKLTLDLLVKM